MREFFHCWRRKVGCLTLLMACVLAAGWVRSLVIGDQVAVAIDTSGHFVTSPLVITTNYFLTSNNGCIRWIRYEIGSNGVNPASVNPSSIWTKVPLDSPSEPFDEFKDTLVHLSIAGTRKTFIGQHYWHWRWQWSQFDFGKGQAYGDAPMFVWVVPYWSILIPLTVLSAFLLLTKPKTSTLKKTAPSFQNEGRATS